jgi:RarD protein
VNDDCQLHRGGDSNTAAACIIAPFLSAQKMKPANLPAALSLTVFGVFIIALMNAAAKALTESGLPPPQVAWLRFAFHCLWMTPAAAFVFFNHHRRRKKADHRQTAGAKKPLSRRTIFGHFLRGALVAGASLLYFPALRDNPLADAIAVVFIFPIFVMFLAAFFLGEKLRRRRLIAAAIAFAGVLVVLRPGGGVYTATMWLTPLAGLAYAGYFVATRAAALRASSFSVSLGTAVGAFILCAPLAIWQWTPPDAEQWQTIALLGAFAAAGHFCIAAACRFADAAVAGVFQYSEIIATAVVGYFVFAHIPDAWVWAGVFLIAGAKIAVTILEMRARRVC